MIITKSEPFTDMNDQKIILESLAMDLKRVAVGMQRGSLKMANRFREEALQREAELKRLEPSEHIKKLLTDSKKALISKEPHAYEDILMYSTLFQNIALNTRDI